MNGWKRLVLDLRLGASEDRVLGCYVRRDYSHQPLGLLALFCMATVCARYLTFDPQPAMGGGAKVTLATAQSQESSASPDCVSRGLPRGMPGARDPGTPSPVLHGGLAQASGALTQQGPG